MPVKAGYLAAAGGGAILLWSGLRGKSWSTVIRDVISGQKPAIALTAYEITPGTPGTSAGTGGSGGAAPVAGPASASERAWQIALLASFPAPPTAKNLHSLTAWRTRECPWDANPPDGALYTHNPFNTTLNMPGATSINSVGVKKYPNAAVGLAATRKTLSGYPQIMAAFRAGKGLCGTASSDLSRWSGGGYTSVC